MLRMDAFCGAVGLLVPPLSMKELHDTHPDITLMKALAHSLVWWPETLMLILKEWFNLVLHACFACQNTSASLGIPQVPLI